jgi:hypothetical protein
VTAAEFQGVLRQVGSIAAERGWASVADFVAVSFAADEVALLAANGADADLLAEWIVTASAGASVSITSLEALPGEPGVGLYADRVVVAFRCGHLLTLEGITAAQQIMSRPSGSYIIVLTGAEDLHDQTELAALERGIWQSLVGDPNVRWAGQDLAEHSCVLWTAVPPNGYLTERLERDMRVLKGWLRTPVTGRDDLIALRADYALQLAERAASASPGGTTGSPTARQALDRLHEVQDSLQELRPRLLRRMDADAMFLDAEIVGSLEDVRRRLVSDIARRVGQRTNARWTDQELRQEVEGVLSLGLGSWQADIASAIDRRMRETDSAIGELFRSVDWELINAVAGGGDNRFPGTIRTHVRALGHADVGVHEAPASDGSPLLPGPDTTMTVFRVTASGAALAAVAALIAWPALVPVVAAGAAGAVGGSLLDRRLDARSNHQAAEGLAKTTVTQAANRALDTVREQVQDAVRSARRTVTADFRDLDGALHTAALREAGQSTAETPLPPAGAATTAMSDHARVTQLRERLNAALANERGESG